jgi:mono/diheme cytochrome c family protein
MRSQIHRTIVVMTALTLTALLAAAGATAQEIYMGTFPQQSGEDLFKNICQGCHMPDAKGAIGAGAYPALADNPRLKAAIYPVVVVLHGQRAMPSFGDSLNDEQIANVINYVRTHFGNHYKDQVSPQAVKAQRH